MQYSEKPDKKNQHKQVDNDTHSPSIMGVSMAPPTFQLKSGPAGAPTRPEKRNVRQPIVEQAPGSAICIEEFIALVEAEERRVSQADRENTKLMITRLRKIFYGAKSWDEHLIPGAKMVPAPYDIRQRERSRTEVEVPNVPDFDLVDTETYPVDQKGTTPQIYRSQEISLPDGSFLDIGHVFAGLDAMNHPKNVSAPGLSDISFDNVGGTTWIGDLGSVLAEAQIAGINAGMQLSDSELQKKISTYASPQDMLGNIDAYALGNSYNIGATCGMKVSDLLKHYYLGEGVQKNQSRRYSIFVESIGLRGWKGTGWANEMIRVGLLADKVNDSAALYLGAGADMNMGNFSVVGGAVVGMSLNNSAQTLVQLFFDALKPLVAKELSQ